MLRLLLPMLFLLLTGCALSPQQVNISPQVTPTQRLNGTPPVQIEVVDQRSRDIIGTRGGLYSDTSFIRAGNDITQAIAGKAREALASMGANVQGGAASATRMTLYLEELSYDVKSQGVFKDVTLKCRIRAVAQRQETRHEGRFISNRTHRFVKAPSDAENEEIINEILGETLSRVINDSELATFIQQRR